MRFSLSSTDKPLYCEMALTTGMLMSGSRSVGILAITIPPRIAIRMAAATNVYGGRNFQLRGQAPALSGFGSPTRRVFRNTRR